MQSLSRQTRPDFEVVIVDNSGRGLVRRNGTAPGARVIENPRNAGFGSGHQPGASRLHFALSGHAQRRCGGPSGLAGRARRRPGGPSRRRHVRFAGAPFRRAPPGFRRHAGGARRQQQAARPRPASGGFSGAGRSPDAQRFVGSLPAQYAGRHRRLRRRFFPLLRRYRSRPARPLGRLEVPVRPAGRGGAPLLAFRRPRLAGQGLLRGTQPPVRAGQELSRAACCWPRRSSP